jgi:lipopolysaccharide export system protein LptC
MATIDAGLAGPAPRSSAAARRARGAAADVSRTDRARVFRQARRHSFIVRTLRLLFPLAAVGAFACYFTGATITVPVGPGKLTMPLPSFDGDNLKMDVPRYEGFTNDGGRFDVTAKTGYQDFRNPTTIKLRTIEGHLRQPTNEWAHLVADDGIYDSKKELLNLVGNIKVVASNGMVAYLKTAAVEVKEQIITSNDPVLVETNGGSTIESERMVVDSKSKEITFEGRVRSHLMRADNEAQAAAGAKPPVRLRSDLTAP